MNTLLVTKAKANRALTLCSRHGVLAQSQERRGQQIDDLFVWVPRCVGVGERFVMEHGGRSVGERCSC